MVPSQLSIIFLLTLSISRSLFFYVKKNHIRMKPSITQFVKEFTSLSAMGEDGYLVEKGLIPLS